MLIAHADPLISAGLLALLRERRDIETLVCSPASVVTHAMVGHSPSEQVVVADYDSGLRLIESAGAERHRVMILTHSGSEAKICHALELGARGYLLLGCSLEDVIDGLQLVHGGGVALGPQVVSRVADWIKQRALTLREEDILRQMMLGLSNKVIARKLTLALGTVKTHVKAILGKLDATSRTEAAVIAQRRGILREECECPPPDIGAVETGKRSSVPESPNRSKWSRLNSRSRGSDTTISGLRYEEIDPSLRSGRQ